MGRARGASAQQPGHGSLTARSNSCAKLRVPQCASLLTCCGGCFEVFAR